MTRSGDDYLRGLRDGRTVLVNGERVADVTTHGLLPAASARWRGFTIWRTIRLTANG